MIIRDKLGRFVKGSQSWLNKKKKPFSDEWKEKIGRFKRGKTYEEVFGVKKSKEIKKKMRLGRKKMKERLGYVNSPETRKLWSLNRRNTRMGKENSNWIDGRSFKPYPSEFNKKLKEEIKKRDNCKCRICKKFGKSVHHIDYNKYNNKVNNLMILCIICNSVVNFDREYWKKTLIAINR